MGRPAATAIAFIVCSLASASSFTTARACSCSGDRGGWVTSSGPAPAEMRGAVFALGEAPTPESIALLVSATRAERVDGERATPMRVEVEPLRDDLVLVVPREPMQPGEVWRFVYVQVGADGAEEEAVELALRTTPTPEKGLTVEVQIGEAMTSELGVAASASCSAKLPAVQRPLKVVLPEALRGTEGAWLFYTEVDGRDWKPRVSLCHRIRSGRTWTEVGTDLLFAACWAPGSVVAQAFTTMGLKPGQHSVRVRVILPGTRLSLKPKAVATTLTCAR